MTLPGSSPRVFLSYARRDGEEFASALRRRLNAEEPEISLWQDRNDLEGGRGWWVQIEEALDRVKFLVIVMTPQAIASETVRKEWRYARQRGVIVYPVKGADADQLFASALPNWMRKAHWHDIGQFTNGEWRGSKEWGAFVRRLKSDPQPKRVPFMAPDMPQPFVPRREFDELLGRVLDPRRQNPVAITTALQGAGGYGKTTLAAALCHDERVSDAFDDGVLWTSLGQTPRLVDEITKLYEALTGEQPPFIDVRQASTRLAEKLEHRNCLVVVDDVWDRAHLEPFLRGGAQCLRLVTTRRFDLVDAAAHVRVDEMSGAESAALLAAALPPGSKSARLAPLSSRLGEWPLLLKLAASMIRQRVALQDSFDGAVRYVERALDRRGVTAFDKSDAAGRDEAVRRTIAASLEMLSSDDRSRFLDLAIFPEDAAVPLTTLMRLWALDDVAAEDCAQRLHVASLLRLDLGRGVVTLHDVMRSYLLHDLADATPVHARLTTGYGDVLSLPDAYAWRWLPYHMLHAAQLGELRALLLRPEWLHAKTRAVGPHALIADVDLMRGDRVLEMVGAAVRLALPALVRDADQIHEQLWERLPGAFSDDLDAFRRELASKAPEPRLCARRPNLQGPGGALRQTLSGHRSVVLGALILQDGRVLSWSGDATLRVWDLGNGESRALTGHEGGVVGAHVLPDGRLLSWSEDRTLRVWDLRTGGSRALTGHAHAVAGVRLLLDGRVVSWNGDATLRVWDLDSGESLALTGHEAAVQGAHVLPDGRVLSWSQDRTLRVWDPDTGASRALVGHEDEIGGAHVLPDGRVLSWSQDRTLRVWDLRTSESRALRGHEVGVTGAKILPDGRVLAWSLDGALLVWDLHTGESRALAERALFVRDAQVLPDGRMLSWAVGDTLRLWDLDAGESRALKGHEAFVEGVLLLPDGRVLSWSQDRTLRVWDLGAEDSRALIGHEHVIVGACVLADERVLSWGWDATLRVWDLGAQESRAWTGHAKWVHGAQLLEDGRALSWSGDATLRVWDLSTGESRALKGHESPVGGAQVRPDGRVLSWSLDGTLRVWDLDTGDSGILTRFEYGLTGALLLPDGRVLAWHYQTLHVWSPEREELELTGHEHDVVGALLLPDGRAASWSEDPTLRVWNLDVSEGRALTGHDDLVIGAQVLSDGRIASWSRDRTLRVWDLHGDSRALTGHEDWVLGARALADGRLLSWSDDGTLRVWNLDTGTSRTFTGHRARVNGALALSSGRLLSWSRDATLRVWDLATAESRVLTGHDALVEGAQLLPDGRVLSRSHDWSIRLWDIDGTNPTLAFYFDATPTVALPYDNGRLFVGDALGRVHLLEILGWRSEDESRH